MTVASINQFRRMAFDRGLEYKVYKNTLIKKALDTLEADTTALEGVLKGSSGILFSPETVNAPAKLIKDFRKKGHTLPLLKGAFIDSGIYVGENQLDTLATIKSKFELIGDVIALLQSPAKNVISGLQGGGNKLAGILKTLSEKE
jgi:large subunit ribosomal protein L10